jgi:hypothetical protein
VSSIANSLAALLLHLSTKTAVAVKKPATSPCQNRLERPVGKETTDGALHLLFLGQKGGEKSKVRMIINDHYEFQKLKKQMRKSGIITITRDIL